MLVQDPLEQQTIFALIEAAQNPAMSLRALCRHLDSMGIKRRGGKKWVGGDSLVRDLLRWNSGHPRRGHTSRTGTDCGHAKPVDRRRSVAPAAGHTALPAPAGSGDDPAGRPGDTLGLGKLHGEPFAPLLGRPGGFLVDDRLGVGALAALLHREPRGLGDRVSRIAVGRQQPAGVLHPVKPAGGPPEPLETVARPLAVLVLDLAPRQPAMVLDPPPPEVGHDKQHVLALAQPLGDLGDVGQLLEVPLAPLAHLPAAKTGPVASQPLLPAPLKRLGGPLADHVGLELGQSGEEDDHQPAHGAVHVDVLAAQELNHDHPHAPLGELLQRVEDVPGRAAQPVQLRDHNHVAGFGVEEEPAALGAVPEVRAPAGSAQRLVEDCRLRQLHGAQCWRIISAWTSGDACCFRVLARVMPSTVMVVSSPLSDRGRW